MFEVPFHTVVIRATMSERSFRSEIVTFVDSSQCDRQRQGRGRVRTREGGCGRWKERTRNDLVTTR